MCVKQWLRSTLNFKNIITAIIAVIIISFSMILYNDKIFLIKSSKDFYNSRNYNYSVVIDKKLNSNTYAFYDKKITFSVSDEMDIGINASVIMEIDCEYDKNDFLHNYHKQLDENEIMISQNVADKYNVKKYDKLYFKNKTNNNIISCTIKYILPYIYGVNDFDLNLNQGVIVMAFNESIIENIQTNYIYFYNNDSSLINTSGANIVGDLINISDVKKNIYRELNIYISITSIIVICSYIVLTFIISYMLKGKYLLRRQYGNSKIYSLIFSDSIIFSSMILLMVLLVYFISCVFIKINYINFLILIVGYLFAIIITNFFMYLVMRRK